MNFDDTPEEAAFRAEVRAWMWANAPATIEKAEAHDSSTTSIDDQDEREQVELRRAVEWQHHLSEAGWAGMTWPREFGGRGGTPIQSTIFGEEAAAFSLPDSNLFRISIGMVGPTLIAHGSDEQKQRHLQAILRGDDIWCQLFSEPGAGSDLASLRTTARRTDDGWLTNGQKVWTTGARQARWGALLARTDGSVPKNRGLTFFIVDMTGPGIDVRPLRQINGDAHFNEVFLTDVHIPLDAVVGDVGDGWRIANTMLLSERGVFADQQANGSRDIIELARIAGRTDDAAVRQEIAKAFGREQVLRLLVLESRTALSKGTSAPLISSITKLLTGVRNRCLANVALDLLGVDGMLDGADAAHRGWWQDRFLNTPVSRIAGGTDEIQKNIIGERFMGLPREPKPDKDLPFDALPKA